MRIVRRNDFLDFSLGYQREVVDRGTCLGNPFVLGRDGDRAQVIAQYRAWLRAEYAKGSGPAYTALMKLARRHLAGERLELACHCARSPRAPYAVPADGILRQGDACHADVIAAAIVGIARKLSN